MGGQEDVFPVGAGLKLLCTLNDKFFLLRKYDKKNQPWKRLVKVQETLCEVI
jgi:hypothetical protein